VRHSVSGVLSVEHLFLAGLGFDIAGGYLVSRGLLAPMPQLATLSATYAAVAAPRAPYAVEDRIRGAVGIFALVFGFVLQAVAYALVLRRAPIHYGTHEALVGLAIALGIGVTIPLAERLVRPRWRDRLLIRVARFEWEGRRVARPLPVAHVLRAFGEQTGRPKRADEDDVGYCARVFRVEAGEADAERVRGYL
jgi:hypothetical protein